MSSIIGQALTVGGKAASGPILAVTVTNAEAVSVVATLGDKSVSLIYDGDKWLGVLPESGAWTVTATNARGGSSSASVDVSGVISELSLRLTDLPSGTVELEYLEHIGGTSSELLLDNLTTNNATISTTVTSALMASANMVNHIRALTHNGSYWGALQTDSAGTGYMIHVNGGIYSKIGTLTVGAMYTETVAWVPGSRMTASGAYSGSYSGSQIRAYGVGYCHGGTWRVKQIDVSIGGTLAKQLKPQKRDIDGEAVIGFFDELQDEFISLPDWVAGPEVAA